jgi:hypothetical protein
MTPTEVAVGMFDLFKFFCLLCLAAVLIRGTRRAIARLRHQLRTCRELTAAPAPRVGTHDWDDIEQHLTDLWTELTREETK